MNLARPEMLFLLALLPAAAIFMLICAGAARRSLAKFGNPELLARAGMAVSGGRRFLKSVLLLAALAFLILALAGPQWGATREKIERKGVDVVIALDTSNSMLAQDVAPDRMKKAKDAVRRLIEMMQGDRVGIVVFSGAAFTMCPLTLDYNAALMFLDIIDNRTVPEAGTNVPEALIQAGKNFDQDKGKHKVIILISDGENLMLKDGAPVDVAEKLAGEGIVIYTVGVGDVKGASIPIETKDGVVDKVDSEGKVVITRLDEDTLKKIALAADGKYRRLDNRASGDELADIYKAVAGLEKKTFDEQYQVHFEERFQWFLAVALACIALEAVIPDRKRRK